MRRSRVVLRPCMIWIAVQLAVGLAILAAEPPNTPAQTAAPSVGKDSSGFLYAIQENGKWGFIDRTGKIRIEPQFDAVDGFSDGLARVEGPGQVFSRTCTREELQAQLDSIKRSRGPYVRVTTEESGMSGVSSSTYDQTTGKWQSSEVIWVNYRVSINGLSGYIDITGTLIIPMQFGYAGDFSEGVAPVVLDGKWGLAKPTGITTTDSLWEGLGPFSEGRAVVLIAGKCGYIDSGGELHVEPHFDDCGPFSEGLAAVMIGDVWGFIDTSGAISIPPSFEQTLLFREGLAAVKRDGRWGFINRSGKTVVKFKYDLVGPFNDGMAAVFMDDGGRFIDHEGKIVFSGNYAGASIFSEGLVSCQVSNVG